MVAVNQKAALPCAKRTEVTSFVNYTLTNEGSQKKIIVTYKSVSRVKLTKPYIVKVSRHLTYPSNEEPSVVPTTEGSTVRG